MRCSSWCPVALAAMTCCAGKTETTDLIFYIDPPDDSGCIGVVGFDVSITSGARTSSSGPLLGSRPILATLDCHLAHPFSLENADLNGSASVTVSGHDGAGVVRVEGTGNVPKLVAGAIHIQLKTSPLPPSPVLVINRSSVLGTKPSDMGQLKITTTMRMETLVTVTPGDYFSVDPAAYGVPTGLAPGGGNTGLALFADVTTVQNTMVRTKLIASWNQAGYYDAIP